MATSMFHYEIALVRDLPRSFADCIKSQIPEEAISVDKAIEQHEKYVQILESIVPKVIKVRSVLDDEPYHRRLLLMKDCCFIEDTCLIIGRKVIMSSMVPASRKPEVSKVKETLEKLNSKMQLGLQIYDMEPPAYMDGGDVLVTGSEILMGISKRTNEKGIAFVQQVFPDRKVRGIVLEEGLHLKSVISALDETTIIIADNQSGRRIADSIAKENAGYKFVFVPDVVSANVLRVDNSVIIQKGFGSEMILAKEIADRGLTLHSIGMSELIKADGALTCCSVFIL